MSDGAKVRVLDFNLAEQPNDYTIFLIPGFITVFQSWHRVIKLLAPEFRILYFESREKVSSKLPSRKMKRKITFDRMARDIKEVIEQMGLEEKKYITFCSSTGGTILIKALSNGWIHPDGAVMVGPMVEFRVSLFLKVASIVLPNILLQTVLFPVAKFYLKNVYVDAEKEPEQVEKYMRAFEEADLYKTKPIFRKMRHYSIWDLPEKVETKTLLVGASVDEMHSTEDCKRVHQLMPNSQYIDLGSNKATHSEPVVEALKGFLHDLDNGSF